MSFILPVHVQKVKGKERKIQLAFIKKQLNRENRQKYQKIKEVYYEKKGCAS